jgi:FkbM family methyltransferase
MNLADQVRVNLAVLRACARNWRARKHEPEAPLVQSLLRPDDICLHIGATDGRHSYLMAQALTGRGHIYAFEPSPVTFPVLTRTMRWHGLTRKVTVAQKAFSDRPQRLTLNVPIKKTGRRGNAFGFVTPANEQAASRPDVEQAAGKGMLHFEVEATTIDEVVATQSRRVDFIRMDIEGSEQLALAGGWKSIDAFGPHLVIEIHPVLLAKQFHARPADIFEAFRTRGYAVYHLEGGRLVCSQNLEITPWKDYFFLHPSRPHRLPTP